RSPGETRFDLEFVADQRPAVTIQQEGRGDAPGAGREAVGNAELLLGGGAGRKRRKAGRAEDQLLEAHPRSVDPLLPVPLAEVVPHLGVGSVDQRNRHGATQLELLAAGGKAEAVRGGGIGGAAGGKQGDENDRDDCAHDVVRVRVTVGASSGWKTLQLGTSRSPERARGTGPAQGPAGPEAVRADWPELSSYGLGFRIIAWQSPLFLPGSPYRRSSMSELITTPRRGFIGRLAAVAAAAGIGSALPAPLAADATVARRSRNPELDAWFGKLKGKHRQVFDAPMAGEGMIAIWPRVYLNTTVATHGEQDGASAMIILRHHALGLAMQDSVWGKYEFGMVLHCNVNGAPARKNPFAKIEGLPISGHGIAELLASGVLVGACDVAMTVYSSGVAKERGLDAAAVRKEWVDALYPGVQLVPSGVYAVGRAQEMGCGYCFAG